MQNRNLGDGRSSRQVRGEVTVDFGSSLNHDKAKYFVLAVSKPEIRIADQLGKDPTPPKRQ